MSAPPRHWQLATSGPKRPPREQLIRLSTTPDTRLRAATPHVPNSPGTLAGHAAVFSTWAPIAERGGMRYMEQIAPGAFRNAIRGEVSVQFNHGSDPLLGSRPLGVLTMLREDATGLYYECSLFPTWGNQELLPAIRSGILGASFRFSIVAEDYNPKPPASMHNPDALPERIVRDVVLYELGPVVAGAYKAATSGLKQPSGSMSLAGNSTASVAASAAPRRRVPRSWEMPVPRSWQLPISQSDLPIPKAWRL